MEGRTRRKFVYAGVVVCIAGVAGCTGDRGGDGGDGGQGQGGDQGGAGGSDPTPTEYEETATEGQPESGSLAQLEKDGTQDLRSHRATVNGEKTVADYRNGIFYADALLDDRFASPSKYKEAGKEDEFVKDISDLAVYMFREFQPANPVYRSASQTEGEGPIEELRFRWLKGGDYAEHRFTPDEALGMWKAGLKEAKEEGAAQSEVLDYVDEQYLEDLRKDIQFAGG